MINSNRPGKFLFVLLMACSSAGIISCRKDGPATGQQGGSMPSKDADVKEIGGPGEEASRTIIHARQLRVPSLPGAPGFEKKHPATEKRPR